MMRALAVALLALGATAACGGDDSAEPATLPPLTSTPPSSTTTPPTSTSGPAKFYEVQPGDSLSSIADQFDVRIEDLIAVNGILDPDHIQAGQKLEIPPPTVLVTVPSSSTP